MVSKRFLKIFKILLILILGLMALGAGVRAKKAGLACPDWPLCFGEIIPDFHPGVYFEFIHRAYAGSISIIFVGCLIYVLRKRLVSQSVKHLMIVAAVVLFGQVVMGAITVLDLVKEGIVTAHLALATMFFACLQWTYFLLSEQTQATPPAPEHAPFAFRFFSRILPFIIFTQILLGGLVASSYAGSVCTDFPLCNGQWVPTLEGPVGLQVMHRFGAYIVFAFVMAIVFYVWKNRFRNWVTARLRKACLLLLLAVLTQVALGITNVVLMVPVWITVFHHLVGILLFAASLRFVYVTLAAYPVAPRARLS